MDGTRQLSLEAYWSVDLPEGQAAVLAALRDSGPATDESLVARLAGALTPSGVRGRRAELVRRGLVQAVSDRGVTAAGRRCTVWGLTPGGVSHGSDRERGAGAAG